MSVDNVSEVAASAASTGGASLVSLLPMVAIFAIFYFFLIRPQLKRQRQVEGMINQLKKGDQVIAAGGLFGTIQRIEDNIIYLEIAENTRVKALKSSVTETISKEEKKSLSEEKEITEKPKAKRSKKLD
jgi:preprotein translocase subunit YajC